MIEVVVSLSLATACFAGQCHPALVGKQTPAGTYQLQQARITAPGYGGDVLLYGRRRDGVALAVHRVLNIPGQRRLERLASDNPDTRRGITGGCVNLMPAVYDKLVDCCANARIIIQP